MPAARPARAATILQVVQGNGMTRPTPINANERIPVDGSLLPLRACIPQARAATASGAHARGDNGTTGRDAMPTGRLPHAQCKRKTLESIEQKDARMKSKTWNKQANSGVSACGSTISGVLIGLALALLVASRRSRSQLRTSRNQQQCQQSRWRMRLHLSPRPTRMQQRVRRRTSTNSSRHTPATNPSGSASPRRW